MAKLDTETLKDAVKSYGFPDFSNRATIDSRMPLRGYEGLPTREIAGGVITYHSSIFAASQYKDYPAAGTYRGETVALVGACNIRLETDWNAISDKVYSFQKIHLKATIPSTVTRERMSEGDILWKVPITAYSVVEEEPAEGEEDEPKTVELKIKKGESFSEAYEIETPEIEETTFHLIALVPIQVRWQEIEGYKNVDNHIDPWGENIGGKRIFPWVRKPAKPAAPPPPSCLPFGEGCGWRMIR